MQRFKSGWEFFLRLALFLSLCRADITDAQNPLVGQAQYAIGSLLVATPGWH